MATTPVYGFRYQALSDAPHGPNLGQNLALDVEAKIQTVDADITALEAVSPYRAVQTLGATTASVTFGSIPTTIRRLTLSFTARSTAAAIAANIWMRINGSSSLAYSANLMRVNGSTQTNAAEGGVDHASVGVITAASAAANNFGAGEIRIFGWHAPHPNLNWTLESHMYENGPNSWHVSGGGLYFAAGPYTSLTLLPDAGSFAAGSDFTLLGWS